ncbi:hypothetical protein DV515_00017633 [Chloebia gouldiae]|uniref:UBX domain-containing protein n=1 Tax=Chloebia gouldiae TaxID=44316 RepID=A0A3L8QAA7_CHLGU|nr:hypothetical protein DV515_00017633 [Chloebia gouldiae]
MASPYAFRTGLRLPDGRALTQSFRAREPLAAVRLFVELQGGSGGFGGAWFPPPSSSWPKRRGAEGGAPPKIPPENPK